MALLKSLKSKTLLWTSLPVVILMAIVAVITPGLLEEMARTVAQQRDVELARISAARLAEKLGAYGRSLQALALEQAFQELDANLIDRAILKEADQLHVFDCGIAVYDAHGRPVFERPATTNAGALFPIASDFDKLRKTLRPIYSNIFKDPASGEEAILIGAPVMKPDGSFAGAIAGSASVRFSALGGTYARLLEFRWGRSGYAYLTDGNGRIIYHRDSSQVGRRLASLPVREAISGRSGSAVIRDEANETIIVGYSPVPDCEWGLVTQETWDVIVAPIRRDRVLLLSFIVVGGVVANLFILFAVGRILEPIRELTAGARRIAEGDFDHAIVARTRDEFHVLSTQFNLMARALKTSYGELENRVRERTRDLESAKQKAEEAEKVKSAFLATMSHELRTPLNSIIGFTGIVLQGSSGPTTEEQRKQLNRVYKSAKHLLALISDILDLSKIEAGRLTVSPASFSVPRVIERVAEDVSPLAREKGLDLQVRLSPDLGDIYSDERRIEQILLNLVNNAIKFTDRGGVSIEGRVSDGRVEIGVTDTGIGIRRKDMGKLFQTFRQIENEGERKQEGTGLGLAICRKLAAMLGGEVRAESEHGAGSTFTLLLPLTFPADPRGKPDEERPQS